MKKFIKSFAIICFVSLLMTGCTLTKKPAGTDNDNTNEIKKVFNDVTKIDSTLNTTQLINFSYENFNINLVNAEVTSLTGTVLEGINQYDIFGTFKASYNIDFNYQGVNVNDLLEVLKPKEFTKVVFKGKDGYELTVLKEDLVNAFLVFKTNGNALKEWGPAKIYVSTYPSESWIESINTIEFK